MSLPDFSRPKLFRYSEHQWLIRSLMLGEFRLVPASYYGELVGDSARYDNELVRENAAPSEKVTITHVATSQPIRTIGDVVFRDEVGTNYYTLSFSTAFDPLLFDEFAGSNACLVIHEPEEVCERIHFYAEQFLQRWSGIDGAVAYGREHKYGPTFIKDGRYVIQKEWRFAWIPPEKANTLHPFCIQIGNLERYAEIMPQPPKSVACAG